MREIAREPCGIRLQNVLTKTENIGNEYLTNAKVTFTALWQNTIILDLQPLEKEKVPLLDLWNDQYVRGTGIPYIPFSIIFDHHMVGLKFDRKWFELKDCKLENFKCTPEDAGMCRVTFDLHSRVDSTIAGLMDTSQKQDITIELKGENVELVKQLKADAKADAEENGQLPLGDDEGADPADSEGFPEIPKGI